MPRRPDPHPTTPASSGARPDDGPAASLAQDRNGRPGRSRRQAQRRERRREYRAWRQAYRAERSTKTVLRSLAVLVATCMLGGLVLAGSVTAIVATVATLGPKAVSLPAVTLELDPLAERSTFTDSAGNLIGIVGEEDRRSVALSEIPPLVWQAVVAVEDRRFFEHEGVDWRGLARAFVEDIEARSAVQGGSSITQQLVKNRVVGADKTLSRKVREMILAYRLESAFTKEQILEEYLNTVYFGQGSYGVASAAERLFAKPLGEVTVAEAALLAGVIAQPESANPFTHPETATWRRSVALDAMERDGIITVDQKREALAAPLPTAVPSDLRPRDPWVEEAQRRLLTDPLYTALGDTREAREEALLRGGLSVVVTKDPRLQTAADEAIAEQASGDDRFRAAMAAIDPATGAVRAMVGAYRYEESQYNTATQYPGRQAGSVWKTITLAAALEDGYSPYDSVDGSGPCSFGLLGQTRNADGGGGWTTLRGATTGSVNCAYVRTELAVGFDKVIDTAYRLGISQRTLAPVLTLTLGAIESTPVEMASVGATLANGGERRPVQFIERITDRDGNVVFDMAEVTGTRAVSPETAACTTSMLEDVVRYGTGTAARIDRPAAGKTGTTNDEADANFLGYVPQLSAFVWYGNPDRLEAGAGYGGEVPARVWRAFMTRALDGVPVVDFPDAGPACERGGGRITSDGRTVSQWRPSTGSGSATSGTTNQAPTTTAPVTPPTSQAPATTAPPPDPTTTAPVTPETEPAP